MCYRNKMLYVQLDDMINAEHLPESKCFFFIKQEGA